jgi:hypothetical protein
LTQDTPDTINRLALSENYDIVNHFAIDANGRQVADNYFRPSVRS